MREPASDDDENVADLMMVTKPEWVAHDQSTVNAIHLHPEGTRLATGGGDSRVRIWACAPIVSEEADRDESVPKVLSVLTVHTGGVNCVRWSPSGHLLASGGDDRTVLLWAHTGSQTTPAAAAGNEHNSGGFAGAAVFPETFRCLSNLVGHEADVQDLAWSPDGRRLASCSVDNSIIVWDADSYQKIVSLTGHTNWVKGLSWDPLDNYLVSQSEDGTCIVWRTDDWAAEHTIRKPFLDLQFAHNYASDINRQIVFRRPSWAPDGQAFVGSYAHHKVFTSPVLNRGTWKKNASFVGHSKPTTVSRFNPLLFRRGDGSQFYVCAVGSMDSSISVWATHSKTPLAIFRHFFAQAVLDIDWTPDGRTMIACSHDGSVAVIQFGPNDFGGVPFSAAEMEKLLLTQQGATSFALPTADNPTALLYRKQGAHVPTPGADLLPAPPVKRARLDLLISGGAPLSGHTASAPATATVPATAATSQSVAALQHESRTADGKRRIVPVSADATAVPAPTAPAPAQTLPAAASVAAPSAVQQVPALTIVKPDHKLKASELRLRFVVSRDDSLDAQAQATLGIFSQLSPVVIEVIANARTKSLLHCSQATTSLWRITLPGLVTHLLANTFVTVAATQQSDLYFLSAHGARLTPPIMLSATPFHMSLSKSWYVLVVCVDCQMSVYNVRKRELVLSCNMGLLLDRGDFVSAVLDSEDHPVVTLTNGDVFKYANALSSWVRTSDDSFVHSELYSLFDHKESLHRTPVALSRMTMEERSMATLAHAEHEVASAELLGDDTSYRKWILMLCRQLVMYARDSHPIYRLRLEELCSGLMGPSIHGYNEDPNSNSDQSRKASKQALLREMLPIIGTNSSLHRLTSDLHEYLQAL